MGAVVKEQWLILQESVKILKSLPHFETTCACALKPSLWLSLW